MIAKVYPSILKGEILSPRSKSSMQRACAAALLHQGITRIIHPGKSNDDLAARDVITRLGAQITASADGLIIESHGVHPRSPQVHCGESGLGIRMFTPIAALSDQPIEVTGSGSLVTRPMDFFDEIFPQLGIRIESNQGRLPLRILGPLRPADITVDGSLSSQFLTGLLMAFSAAGAADVTIRVRGLKSRPYIDLTLAVMRSFGMNVPTMTPDDAFIFEKFSTPPAGPVTYDRAVLDALTSAGGQFAFVNDVLEVRKSDRHAFEFDATECPDLFPPLTALAALAKGVSVIRGVSRLAHKESDRGVTLQEEFGRLGVTIRLDGDLMHIEGGGPLAGAPVHSRHDHRIAMALAVAGLRADAGITEIADAEAIRKSYPDFFDDIRALGARVDILP
ncbi:MAG: 3-phosphoshikimate 1-carboxyvinyltransferase [Chitinophagaceae bacterium]|nr:3-phosphoshikimate 1-carboxyvinyltransferase [Chitinophagaceae bacterium]